MTDEKKPYRMHPGVEAAWNFPLFEAMMGRRSRRFGFGMELEHGPFLTKLSLIHKNTNVNTVKSI